MLYCKILPLMLGFCFACWCQAAPVYESKELGAKFPEQLAGLPFARVFDYESKMPGLGVGVKYADDDTVMDVYIYNLGLEKIPENLDDPIVSEHFKQVIGEVFGMEKSGAYQHVKLGGTKKITTVSGREFLTASLTFEKKGVPQFSVILLTVSRDQFFKIRHSSAGEQAADHEKALAGLLDELTVSAGGTAAATPRR